LGHSFFLTAICLSLCFTRTVLAQFSLRKTLLKRLPSTELMPVELRIIYEQPSSLLILFFTFPCSLSTSHNFYFFLNFFFL
jgi:hypothetical protein